MSFLRRLLGGDKGGGDAAPPQTATPAEVEAAERAHELEMAREDAARLDELAQRQVRYARHAWTPEPQGGSRRADDDTDAEDDES